MDINLIGRSLASQMLASLGMLKDCMDRCPQGGWQERDGDYPFSQVVFHALFDCDLCLSKSFEELKGQAFHLAHGAVFAGYEELEEGPRTRLYEPAFLASYHGHCKAKIEAVLGQASAEVLLAPKGDIYGTMTRLERYVNATRHLQHHGAQLGLRLQLASGAEMEWVGRAYPDVDSAG